MDKESTYGLRIDQMAGLFAMGREEPNLADNGADRGTMAGLLRRQLASTLPKHSLLFDALLMMMDQEGYDTQSLRGRSLGDVLLDPLSDLDLLRAIKNCSKRLSHELDSEVEAALATTIYFASLASALVFHDRKITQHPYEKLDESFTELAGKTWMARQLTELFSRAREVCASKKDER
jgi:hypothetical protein